MFVDVPIVRSAHTGHMEHMMKSHGSMIFVSAAPRWKPALGTGLDNDLVFSSCTARCRNGANQLSFLVH